MLPRLARVSGEICSVFILVKILTEQEADGNIYLCANEIFLALVADDGVEGEKGQPKHGSLSELLLTSP